ncbi:tryptophan-rich sensory protein [Mucilaginibacter hurinus]|uniref:Tryptophan-rich sensory protein n=1 Tax=Mucilaginibacter hurinus TaxID=2201324 RepID=A0A367GMF5_9SPHI|nr:TspO/MBR family protein [Mucilaginibacter hurinus]RCH54056.1 tryptophan-rich sensory protein [Mucilaginibacter hurinus]
MSNTQSTQKTEWLPLIICIAIPVAIGITASYFTDSDSAWYLALKKPSFNPPGWLFAPVWTSLYIMMGVASYLVWQNRENREPYFKARSLYVMQLILNFSWSFIFFQAHNVLGALVIIVLLWVLIVACIFSFKKLSTAAAWLMVPYILWVSFATVLNYSILRLNE